MTSSNIRYLRENGPSTAEELPTAKVSTYDRMHGVWKFSPTGNHQGASAGNTAEKLTLVYYLRGEHDPVDVVEKWADVNADNIENGLVRSFRARLRRQGSEFHDAIDDVLPPRGEIGD